MAHCAHCEDAFTPVEPCQKFCSWSCSDAEAEISECESDTGGGDHIDPSVTWRTSFGDYIVTIPLYIGYREVMEILDLCEYTEDRNMGCVNVLTEDFKVYLLENVELSRHSTNAVLKLNEEEIELPEYFRSGRATFCDNIPF